MAPGLLALAGLAACTPGAEGNEGNEPTTEGSTTTGEPSADASSTSQVDPDDTTGGSTTDASGTEETSTGVSTEATSTGVSTEATSTGAEPVCGDGIVEGSEDCDGAELLEATCESQGFVSGTLACDAACAYDVGACSFLPSVPVLQLSFSQIKQFDFSWAASAGAEHYELLESASPADPFVPLAGDIVGESISITMPLHFRHEASYVLRACNGAGCTDSAPVSVMGSLAEAVGYFKASNTGSIDLFGGSVALSTDGNTLAVGAYGESSNATGIDGDQTNDTALHAGAVYVFVRDGAGAWSQQAYVKASNTDAEDGFGNSVALSEDGNTLAVGAPVEDSNATGIDGDQVNDSAQSSGAVYVFMRDGAGAWSQQAYVKASNTGVGDWFGKVVELSGDGNTLAVGARPEDGNATGIGGDEANDSATGAGAVYVFARDAMQQWSQEAYVKASNTQPLDAFGYSVALSGDGNTLAVGAIMEDSDATGIDGDQANDSASASGAVYVFARDAMQQWSQEAYVKASNTDPEDRFGWTVALSGDGNTLAVGTPLEDSLGTGIGGNQGNDIVSENSGAVYLFVRDAMQQWSQEAYVKASNADGPDWFGVQVALSDDGNTLAVGARSENSNATGINGEQINELAIDSGAVYVFARDAMEQWSQRAYVKASNTDADDGFGNGMEYSGNAMALSGDGNTLAASAREEASNATGIGGDQANDSAPEAGAVYLF